MPKYTNTILVMITCLCASCGGGASLTKNINTNVSPTINTSSTINVNENTINVTNISASDHNGDDLLFSISGGDDASLFSINENSGALLFNTEPDFENPVDANTDNLYEIEITVSDGQLIDTLSTTISVNNVALSKLWDKQYGGTEADVCRGIVASDDGGFVIAGHSHSDADGNKSQDSRGYYDFWLVKIDNNGDKIWDKRFGGQYDEYCNSIIKCSDGNYLLAGYTTSPAGGDVSEVSRGNRDFWLLKVDNDGNKIWDKRYGGSGFDDGVAVFEHSDGTIVIAGCSNSGISGDKSESLRGFYDIWAVKVDSNGNKIWDKTFGSSMYDCCLSLHIYSDGAIVLGGFGASGIDGDRTVNSWGSHDMWIIKVDSNGNKIWDKRFGTGSADYCRDIAPCDDGGLLMITENYSGIYGDRSQATRGGSDYWIIKIDNNGNKVWDKRFGGSENDIGQSIATNIDGSFIISGISHSGADGDKSEPSRGGPDYWMLKIDSVGNKIWDKSFGGEHWEYSSYTGGCVIANNNDGFILVGDSTSNSGADKSENLYGNNDFWIINYGEGSEEIPPTILAPSGITHRTNAQKIKHSTAMFLPTP